MKTPSRRPLLAPVVASLAAVGALLFLPAFLLARNASAGTAAPDACEKAGPGCPELVELQVKDVLPLPEAGSHAVVLATADGELVLPLFVDEGSAVAIAFRLAHRAPPHPLAHDLLDRVVSGMGGKVTEVRIDELVDDVFHGRVFIRQGKRSLVLAARPSDSIAMALTAGNARIRVARNVLDAAGVKRNEVDALRGRMGVGGSGPGTGGSGDDDALPPGHPPIDGKGHGDDRDGLPPGHPPIGGPPPPEASDSDIRL